MNTQIYKITKYINKHNSYRAKCLNLIASENLASPYTRFALNSDLVNRYTVGQPNNRWYAGCDYFDKIEKSAIAIAQKLFQAKYVNIQPTSGIIANMIAYYTLLEPNDLVMSLSVKNSGHYSHAKTGVLSLFQARVVSLPFDQKNFSIDLERAEKLILKKKPKVIILGTSEFLFPAPISSLRKICDKTGTKIIYDASHVAGLIAAGEFQQPLIEGTDILTTSTNKTLSSPNHGLIATNYPSLYQKRIEQAIVPMFTSNNHPHHIASLAITLSEFDEFGKDYAKQVIKNAQALAKALYENGVQVLCHQKNFTQSHIVLFDAKNSGKEIMRLLQKVNIIVNPFQLPWNTKVNQTGIRIGTNEVTRLGMKEKELKIIAKFISDALYTRKSLKKIRKEVIEFRKQYQSIYYCFNSNVK